MSHADGVPDILDDLLDRLAHLEGRVQALEATMDDHQAGATRRQAEVDQLTANYERLRYAQRTGRQP